MQKLHLKVVSVRALRVKILEGILAICMVKLSIFCGRQREEMWNLALGKVYTHENILSNDSFVESTLKMIGPFEGQSLIIYSNCYVMKTYTKHDYYHVSLKFYKKVVTGH